MTTADSENPPVEQVGAELVDEAAERLMDRADASGAALLGEGGLLTQIVRALLERALEVEMTEHLGYEKPDPAGRGSGNSRNGTSSKTMLADIGAVTVAVPPGPQRGFPAAADPEERTPAGGVQRADPVAVRARHVGA